MNETRYYITYAPKEKDQNGTRQIGGKLITELLHPRVCRLVRIDGTRGQIQDQIQAYKPDDFSMEVLPGTKMTQQDISYTLLTELILTTQDSKTKNLEYRNILNYIVGSPVF